MDFQILCHPAEANSPQDVVIYFNNHLRSTAEAGQLRNVPGYVGATEQLVPRLANRSLWAKVGLEAGADHPSDDLIRSLCQGFDKDGRGLARIALFQPPTEIVLTCATEISEALEPYPALALLLMEQNRRILLEEIEEVAVRVRNGSRGWQIKESKVLGAGFVHGRNKLNEPHLHSHDLIFPPVFTDDGKWLTYANRSFINKLNIENGVRSKITKATCQFLNDQGFEISLNFGRASRNLLHGATVRCPDGRIIEAGSIARERLAIRQAEKQLLRRLGVQPPTSRELALLKSAAGGFVGDLPHIRRPDVFRHKLETLGLIGPSGQIVTIQQMTEALRETERKIAQIQVSLASLLNLPRPQLEAMERAIEGKRLQIVNEFHGISMEASTAYAKVSWTNSYSGLLNRLIENRYDGVRSCEISQEEANLLEVLLRAGHVFKQNSTGTAIYVISEHGARQFESLCERIKQASEQRFLQIACLNPQRSIVNKTRDAMHSDRNNGTFRISTASERNPSNNISENGNVDRSNSKRR